MAVPRVAHSKIPLKTAESFMLARREGGRVKSWVNITKVVENQGFLRSVDSRINSGVEDGLCRKEERSIAGRMGL
jgi:hypothetical protein